MQAGSVIMDCSPDTSVPPSRDGSPAPRTRIRPYGGDGGAQLEAADEYVVTEVAADFKDSPEGGQVLRGTSSRRSEATAGGGGLGSGGDDDTGDADAGSPTTAGATSGRFSPGAEANGVQMTSRGDTGLGSEPSADPLRVEAAIPSSRSVGAGSSSSGVARTSSTTAVAAGHSSQVPDGSPSHTSGVHSHDPALSREPSATLQLQQPLRPILSTSSLGGRSVGRDREALGSAAAAAGGAGASSAAHAAASNSPSISGSAAAADAAAAAAVGRGSKGSGSGAVSEHGAAASPHQLASMMAASPLGHGVCNSRPLVMPFAERRNAAAAAAEQQQPFQRGGGSAPAGLVGSISGAPGAGVGRRQGTIRHGPAYNSQSLLYGSSGGGGGAGSGSKNSNARRRPDRDASLETSTQGTPGVDRTPHTTEGGMQDNLPVPPLHAVSSREWDKPPPRGAAGGGYAAGGGAAAVKAAVAAAAAATSGGGGFVPTAADQQLQQSLILGEAIRIRGVHKVAAGTALSAGSVSASVVGMAGVPGRRGRRIVSHPSTASATAAAMAAYFAGVEASIADGSADKVLLPSGLARRLKAARMMASGPPPFQRRREPPPPPSPAGIKLDGFMLLEAADEEMPEAVQAASLESRHISAVESADLSYFVALRTLDVSDNKLPDLICLANLQALVRLRAASCRLHTLGVWPGTSPPITEAGASVSGQESTTSGGVGGFRSRKNSPRGVSLRQVMRAGGLEEGSQQQGQAPGQQQAGVREGGAGAGGDGAAEAAALKEEASGATGTTDGAEEGKGSAPGDRAPAIVAEQADGAAQAGAGATAAAPATAAANSASVAAAPAVAIAPTPMSEPLVASIPVPLPPNPFQFLEVLDLSYNQLQPHMVLLPTSPLAQLPRLTDLDLSSNHFKALPSPEEIAAAAIAAAMAAMLRTASGDDTTAVAATTPAAAGVALAFPALRRLRLANNSLKGSAIASLAALSPPCLTHLDLSHNVISEAPRLKSPTDDPNSGVKGLNLPPGQQQQLPLTLQLQHQEQQEHEHIQQLLHQHPQYHQQQQQHLHPQQQQQQQQMRSASAEALEQRQQQERFAAVLKRLAVLDLTYNKVATEAAVAPLLHLPALQRLLLAGNPIVVSLQRPHHGRSSSTSVSSASALSGASPKLDFGLPDAPAPKPTVAASLTARFARITEVGPKQQVTTLATAAAAVITAAAAPERVTEAFDRMDATIEQWRLNTVMEEDEEEDDDEGGEEGAEDRTFLTGVGIQERRRNGSTTTGTGTTPDDLLEAVSESLGADGDGEEAPPPLSAMSATPPPLGADDDADEQPLWESITDPTERLAVALGLDPMALPMHTGALTIDSAGAIAALRFALAHPLVEANDGLAPHPHYAAATTAAQLKRKPRRLAAPPPQRLAPMAARGGAAAAAVLPPAAPAVAAAAAGSGSATAAAKVAKIQTVEAMLEGMKGKLAALEASLAAQLAAAPAPTAEALSKAMAAASKGRYGHAGRPGDDDDEADDAGSTGSGLPEEVIDQIERESEDEVENDVQAIEVETGNIDPREGIVLMADQLAAEEEAYSTPGPLDGNRAGSLTPGAASRGAAGVTLSPSPLSPYSNPKLSPQALQQISGARQTSPLRGGAAAAGTGVSRKTLAIGGVVGGGGAGAGAPSSAASPPLSGVGAAAALGYAA